MPRSKPQLVGRLVADVAPVGYLADRDAHTLKVCPWCHSLGAGEVCGYCMVAPGKPSVEPPPVRFDRPYRGVYAIRHTARMVLDRSRPVGKQWRTIRCKLRYPCLMSR